MNSLSPLDAFTILYGIFAVSVLLAVTFTAASQPQLGFWATFKAAFKVLDRVLTAAFVLGIGFMIIVFIGLKIAAAH